MGKLVNPKYYKRDVQKKQLQKRRRKFGIWAFTDYYMTVVESIQYTAISIPN
jgi:hypothetical protein